MVFSSASFLFVFLPAVFIVNFLLPSRKAQNIWLTICSLIFYGYGEPVFVFIMILSVFINYLLALGITDHPPKKKLLITLAVVFNLALIGVFKYAAFTVTSINGLTRMHLPVPHIALPIGISFFTFQVLSYVIDVYRDPGLIQRDYFKVLFYVSFFPQLIAGPIVKYHDVYDYILNRKKDTDEIARGIRRFIIGLAKKLFIANAMGAIADQMFTLELGTISTATAWIGAVTYSLQIYFDFCAYSDMAIGIGHMFGFTFLENFNYPYISISIQEFWRRWHISLSTWFKEYLYIPLGGNRKGKGRTYLNKVIVFFATGLWHGASWCFVLWGMIHGAAIILEDVTHLNKFFKRFKPLGWLYTMLIVVCAFVLFRADDFTLGGTIVMRMFAYKSSSILAHNTIISVLTPWNLFLFAVALVASTPVVPYLSGKFREHQTMQMVSYTASIALLLICMLNLANSSYNPFIYFRF